MPINVSSLPDLTPSDEALQHTRFSSWFPNYRQYSVKASFIDVLDIQPDFLQWLTEDGLILPEDSDDRPIGSAVIRDIDEEHSDDDDDDDASTSARDFSALNQRIREIIDTYDGAVFPKMDWSAPLDAAWMVPGASLRCTEPSDVYLLLKSSDFITKDIGQLDEMQRMPISEANPVRPTLVLKKFFEMPRANEFRCFVRAGQLVCISQRDTGTFFEHLQDPQTQHLLLRKLQHFYDTVLKPETPSSTQSSLTPLRPFPIRDFVWDAYLTRDLERTMIVDINPYIERTDSLLWQWDEIEKEAKIGVHSQHVRLPTIRVVTSRAQTTQSFPTYAHNMMPADVFDLSHGADIANFAISFNDQLAQAVKDVDENTEEGRSTSAPQPPRPGR